MCFRVTSIGLAELERFERKTKVKKPIMKTGVGDFLKLKHTHTSNFSAESPPHFGNSFSHYIDTFTAIHIPIMYFDVEDMCSMLVENMCSMLEI